jgi:oxygen-independent coproporphyrinogen-3 oxidase
MCNHFISWSEAASKFGVSETEVKSTVSFDENTLSEFVSDGLIKFAPGEIEVTDLGKFFVRNIAASFDPNLKNAIQKFSKSL